MRDKGVATAVATLLAAFATAHLMQFGLSAGRSIAGGSEAAPIGLATLVAAHSATATEPLPPGPPPFPVLRAGAPGLHGPPSRDLPRDAGTPEALAAEGRNGFGQSCERTLALEVDAGAVLRARLHAPCDPGVRVEMRHAGLRFAVETGADGRQETAVPALLPNALVEAAFADGTVLRARAAVPEAGAVERVAVVADGWAGLSLRAFEYGARRADPGEVSAGSASRREGAFFRLGTPGIAAPLVAEVYTLPSGRFGVLGEVRMQVEAEVTGANCARDVTAEMIRSQRGAPPARVALRLAMPGCGAEGDVLVVELPEPDLRVARN